MPQCSTIVIVDNSPAGREAVKGVLTGQGYEVSLAENSAQALEQAAHMPPISFCWM